MTKNNELSVTKLLQTIKAARVIKNWTEEYRIYSPSAIVVVYIDNEGTVGAYASKLTDGKVLPTIVFGEASKKITKAIKKRFNELYLNNEKTK